MTSATRIPILFIGYRDDFCNLENLPEWNLKTSRKKNRLKALKKSRKKNRLKALKKWEFSFSKETIDMDLEIVYDNLLNNPEHAYLGFIVERLDYNDTRTEYDISNIEEMNDSVRNLFDTIREIIPDVFPEASELEPSIYLLYVYL